MRQAAAVVVAMSGVSLVIGGQAVCERVLIVVNQLLPQPVSPACPVGRPPELWWTAAFMQLGALVLWLPPQRTSQLWRRPFFRLRVRRRFGSIAGTVLMAAGVGLVLATAVGEVLDGRFSEQAVTGRTGTPLAGDSPAVVSAAAGMAAIWWGASEL